VFEKWKESKGRQGLPYPKLVFHPQFGGHPGMAFPVYPSDLNDAEWAVHGPLISTSKPHGRPRSSDMRRITNGVFYLLRTGCAWRFLPREYGAWPTV
jgi:hypothetical protein